MEEALRIRVVNPSFRLWPHVRTNFNIILDLDLVFSEQKFKANLNSCNIHDKFIL